MLKLGIVTEDQYLSLQQESRKFCGARVAYNLLDVGEHPTDVQIRVFEDISFTLRTSNGTFRTTFRRRFANVDAAALRWMEKLYPPEASLSVQDRAASHGLTSKEFAERIFKSYPQAEFEASDVLLALVELTLDTGEIYIVEQNGTPLQYIKAPFVVSLYHPESVRYPINRWVAARARRRFHNLNLPQGWAKMDHGPGFKVRQIPYIHPEVVALSRRNPHFRFQMRSIFDRTPGACDVLRTMNIFNRAYFSDQQLAEGASVAHESIRPGGIWIVGRTLEEDFTNHVSVLRRNDNGWQVLERIGTGSEIEEVALSAQST